METGVYIGRLPLHPCSSSGEEGRTGGTRSDPGDTDPILMAIFQPRTSPVRKQGCEGGGSSSEGSAAGCPARRWAAVNFPQAPPSVQPWRHRSNLNGDVSASKFSCTETGLRGGGSSFGGSAARAVVARRWARTRVVGLPYTPIETPHSHRAPTLQACRPAVEP